MTPHVVDASLVIKWFVDEVHAEAARPLPEDPYELFAPDLLWPACGAHPRRGTSHRLNHAHWLPAGDGRSQTLNVLQDGSYATYVC
jgi:predicted nucleic acid-binding protein